VGSFIQGLNVIICLSGEAIPFVKRRELIKYIESKGAIFLREGRRHSIYGRDKLRSEIPRHNEIIDELARKICRDLDIPFIR
jgi:mRNA interferase HicA